MEYKSGIESHRPEALNVNHGNSELTGRFYTAGVSYFQYRVPAARSNLCRTSELYVTGTARPA